MPRGIGGWEYDDINGEYGGVRVLVVDVPYGQFVRPGYPKWSSYGSRRVLVDDVPYGQSVRPRFPKWSSQASRCVRG